MVYSDKRNSGISTIGEVPWGTSLCQFYQTRSDIPGLFIPYLSAGLANNELCVWVTFYPEAALETVRAVADIEKYLQNGQLEIVPYHQWQVRGKKVGAMIASKLDFAISKGCDGLRLAFDIFSGGKGARASMSQDEADMISRLNVLSLHACPRAGFDAVKLMKEVKKYRFALVCDAGKWEVIESSEARIANEALRRSEEKLNSLFSHMKEGFAHHRIVLDSQGKPCDYIFLEVNDAFERLVGVKREELIGRRVTSVLPGIEKDPADWIGKCGKVALTGRPVRFESYSEPLKKWYSVSAFCPHKGFFAVTFSDITDRKNSEDILLKANTEWERTFNSVPDLIAILDDRHTVVRANLAMADRLGMTPEKCVGLHCYEVVHGLSSPPGFCPHSLTCHDHREHVAEVHEPRLGGDFIVSTTPIVDERGRLTGSVHVARDITERKKVEMELLRLNRELRAISDCNQAIVRSNDEQALYKEVCHIMCDSVGYKMAWIGVVEKDEAKSILPVASHGDDGGYLAAANITWADTERGRGPTGTAARTGQTDFCQDFITDPRAAPWREGALVRGFRSSIAIPLRGDDGGIFAVFSLYAAEPNGFTPAEVRLLEELAGDLSFGIGVLRTRLERIRAEEALRETRDYLDNLFNYANAPIIVWNPEFKITRFNHAFERLTGRSAEEVLGERLHILFPDDSRKASMDYIRKAMSGEHWEVVEIPVARLDGTVRTVLWNSANLYSPDGNTLVATIAQGQDITQRKLAEEELRRRNVELEASNQELEAFSYSVSHDLRAPLRSMEGFSSALLEDYFDKLDDQGKQYLKYVQESSDLMGELIDGLLRLSRVTRSDMNYEVVDLSELAHEVFNELAKAEPHPRMELEIAPHVTAYGDRNLMRLMLENLLGNAWKFSGKVKSPRIQVGVTGPEGRRAYFVRDNGVGFDMTYADKLFKPFQRLHKATEFAGTGIGLATVQRIVRRHGGKVWAEGKAGEGATFYFTLG